MCTFDIIWLDVGISNMFFADRTLSFEVADDIAKYIDAGVCQ